MNATLPLVVHVIDELPPDGAERLIVDLLRRRSPLYRYEVLCLVQGGPLESELRSIGVPVTVLGRQWRWDLGLMFRLVRWLHMSRADVVHTHLFTADLFGRIAARLARCKGVFTTVHSINGWKSRTHRAADRLLSLATTRVIACTDEVGRVLVQRDRISPRRVQVIENGIDLMRFSLSADPRVRAELDVPPGVSVLGVVGRLHPAKGHADLLDALALLKMRGAPPWRCLFVGEGDQRPELERLVFELNLSREVIFLGLRDDVPRILPLLDVLVVPSRWEGLPMALLEAMACARPVVATAVGGIPFVVKHEVTGLLVQPGEKVALAEALSRLLASPALASRLGNAGRTHILAHHDVATTAKAYEELYAAAVYGPAPEKSRVRRRSS